MAISMLKIRRPLGRLIFNMGIAIPGKTVFLIETAPWQLSVDQLTHLWVQDGISKKYLPHKQSGTKPNLVAKILATNFGDRLA